MAHYKEKEPLSRDDRWVKILNASGSLRATALTAQSLVREAIARHKLNRYDSIALGEILVAGLLMAARQKPGGRISISLKGNMLLKQAVADSTAEGTVRGFLISRESPQGPPDFGQLGPWGEGLISVAMLNPGEKDPYVGNCELATGHIAKDLTVYINQSEQIPTAVGISVVVNDAGEVLSAGGFIVEVLPGTAETEVESIESNILNMESIATQLSTNSNPTLLLSHIFAEQQFTILDEKPVYFICTCSRERVVRALSLLGGKEIQEMIDEDGGADVKCDFCNTDYNFGKVELETLFEK